MRSLESALVALVALGELPTASSGITDRFRVWKISEQDDATSEATSETATQGNGLMYDVDPKLMESLHPLFTGDRAWLNFANETWLRQDAPSQTAPQPLIVDDDNLETELASFPESAERLWRLHRLAQLELAIPDDSIPEDSPELDDAIRYLGSRQHDNGNEMPVDQEKVAPSPVAIKLEGFDEDVSSTTSLWKSKFFRSQNGMRRTAVLGTDQCKAALEEARQKKYFLSCRAYAAVLYNPDAKIAYLRNPKSGSTFFDGLFWDVLSGTRTLLHNETLPDDTFFFTFVESPVTRIRKAYASLSANQERAPELTEATFVDVKRTEDSGNARFRAFLDDLVNSRLGMHAWTSASTQSAAVACTDVGKALDFVGYLESFNDDFKALATAANLSALILSQVPSEPQQASAHFRMDMNLALSTESLREICSLYKTDFQCFGYEMPPQCKSISEIGDQCPPNAPAVTQADPQLVFEPDVNPQESQESELAGPSGRRFLGTDICRRGFQVARESGNPSFCRAQAVILWSEQYKLAYLKTPKAASNSIEKLFTSVFSDARHLKGNEVLPADSLLFTFVEDPLLHARKGFAAVNLMEAAHVNVTTRTQFQSVSRDSRCGNDRFIAFLVDLARNRFGPESPYAPELASAQTSSIACASRRHRHKVDFVGHLERIDHDWAVIQTMAGIPANMRTKATLMAQESLFPAHPFFEKDLNIPLTNASIWAACGLYVTDWSCLGYELPPACLPASGAV